MMTGLLDKLKESAARPTWIERTEEGDVVIYELAGGNIDDAYERGLDDGETLLAREILVERGETW